MKQILKLTEKQFNKVTDKIYDCQANRDQREYDLNEELGREKENEDRYETDNMLALWIGIESHLESFLNELGYEFDFCTGRFLYKEKIGRNW